MISLSEIRNRINIQNADEETKIKGILDGVLADFERRTQRLWCQRTNHILTFRPLDDEPVLFSKLFPMTAITVEEKDPPDAFETVDAGDLDVEMQTGRVERLGTNSFGTVFIDQPWKRVVQFTVSGGIAEGQAPDDVREAIALQVLFLMKRTSPNKVDLKSSTLSTTVGGNNSSDLLSPNMHPVYQNIVGAYRVNG